MSEAPSIAIEVVLAALIENSEGGMLSLPAALLTTDRTGKVIAIDYNEDTDEVYFTIQEDEDIAYDI
jgi:hypothetical protein